MTDFVDLAAEAEEVMPAQLRSLRLCAKPVVFDTGIPDAHFSVAGTLFLVGFRRRVYVLAPRHVVLDWPMERLAILLSKDGERLPLDMRWKIRVIDEDGTVDEKDDISDLVIYRADLATTSAEALHANKFINLDVPGVVDWFDSREESTFFLFGHPTLGNHADYDRSKVIQTQYLLPGKYIGESVCEGCYELAVDNPTGLANFDGLSGSPVLSLLSEYKTGIQPKFCGMALRATATSKRVHFLAANVIIAALDRATKSESAG